MSAGKTTIAALCLAALLAWGACRPSGPADPEPPRDLALVLSGGGAKGAYEVGVWLAMRDLGLDGRVEAVSGTSVGAINAALFAAGIEPDRIEALWLDKMGGILSLSDKWIAECVDARVRDFREDESSAKWKSLVGTLADGALEYAKFRHTGLPTTGALDPAPLRRELAAALPRDWPRRAPAAYATAVERSSFGPPQRVVFRLNDASPDERVDMVCASAAIPFALPSVDVRGKTCVDGGTRILGFPGRLLNADPVRQHPSVKTVVAVYLDDEPHVDPSARLAAADLPEGVRLVEIFPSEDVGGLAWGWQGVFDASPSTGRHLVDLGRADALRALRAAGLGR